MELIQQPDMEVVGPIDVHLFGGCCLEAQRADNVSLHLEGLRNFLAEGESMQLMTIIEEMRATSRHLRELSDLSQVHQDRVPIVLNHLNVLLPCVSRTLRDITNYYEDRTLSKKNRWRTMYHQMMDEADGTSLAERFVMYNDCLECLRDVLIRSPHFDLNGLEKRRLQIMQLRENRGIPPPPAQVGPRLRAIALSFEMDPTVHWAQQIFSQPLPSRTAFKNQYRSVGTGPHQVWGQLWTPEDSRILFRRPFNNDELCLIAYESGRDGCSSLLLRTINPDTGAAWFSQRGAHELCIDRAGSVLRFKRWSRSTNTSKLWAALNFQTWEELILMYCAFLALKAHNERTIDMNPDEYTPKMERKLFQARISDDGFWHSLIVYKDKETGGIRLHAAVWDGALRQCPVWTAFVTHQATSPTWIRRISRRRVRLADIQLYVFCQDYRQHRQRRGQAGAFEISFHAEEGCDRFIELFPIPLKQVKTPLPKSPR